MTRFNAQLKESDTYEGTVSYLPKTANRPMYVRLDWKKPVTEQLVTIGDEYVLYNPQLNQRVLGNLKNIGTNTSSKNPLQFMSMSVEQLKAENVITYLGQEKIGGQTDSWHIETTPNSATSYRSADIWIDNDGMPRQFRINELNSDTTTVLLSNIQKNITLNAEIFDLKYPSTVKTIRN